MTETIDIFAKRDTVPGMVLLSLMTRTAEGQEFIRLFFSNDETPTEIKVECRVNGVPVNFSEIVELLWNGREDHIREAAQGLVHKRFREIFEQLNDVEEAVVNLLQTTGNTK